MEDSQASPPLEAPRGIYPARVDDKGRLKLPVPFQQYLSSFSEGKLFVTSLNRSTAQIYPVSLWRVKKNQLEDRGSQVAAAYRKTLVFNANDLGSDSELDGQGRVLLSPELRRALEIENQPVRIMAKEGVVDVMSEANYQAQLQKHVEATAAAVAAAEEAGLL